MARNSETTATRRRGPGRPWKPGQSGNPKGRPPLPAEHKKAFFMMEPEAMEGLRDIINDPRHPQRRHACEYVINRLHGTPTTRTEVSGPDGKPISVSPEDPVAKFVRGLMDTMPPEQNDQQAPDAAGGKSSG